MQKRKKNYFVQRQEWSGVHVIQTLNLQIKGKTWIIYGEIKGDPALQVS